MHLLSKICYPWCIDVKMIDSFNIMMSVIWISLSTCIKCAYMKYWNKRVVISDDLSSYFWGIKWKWKVQEVKVLWHSFNFLHLFLCFLPFKSFSLHDYTCVSHFSPHLLCLVSFPHCAHLAFVHLVYPDPNYVCVGWMIIKTEPSFLLLLLVHVSCPPPLEHHAPFPFVLSGNAGTIWKKKCRKTMLYP